MPNDDEWKRTSAKRFSADQNTQPAERVKTASLKKPLKDLMQKNTQKKGIHVCSAETRFSCYFLMVNDSIVGLTNAARE